MATRVKPSEMIGGNGCEVWDHTDKVIGVLTTKGDILLECKHTGKVIARIPKEYLKDASEVIDSLLMDESLA